MGKKNTYTRETEFPTYISNWSNHYSAWKNFKKNYLLIRYEDLIKNPAGVLDKLQIELGLPFHKFAPRDLVVTKSRSRPPMLTETRAFLRAFYAPSLASLRRVLGRDLPEAWM